MDKQITKLLEKVGEGQAQEADGGEQHYVVVVYNLPSYVNSEVLEAQFAEYGTILSASVSGPKTDNLGNTTQIGYIAYQREEDAKRAITEANSATVYQNKVTVVQYKSVQQRIQENADIRVTGLPKNWKVKDVEDYFCRQMGMNRDQIFKNSPNIRPDVRPAKLNSNGSEAFFTCVSANVSRRLVQEFKGKQYTFPTVREPLRVCQKLTRGMMEYKKATEQKAS